MKIVELPLELIYASEDENTVAYSGGGMTIPG
jgi:hypothetical protein